ncbi:type VI secretion system accessory protein TagJ [Neisseria sp. Ec49-e6-T10]|uniref:type VI secretion system accessory protein TagJ n=1 Tax=Neisseria sp. Ec49-e6-T10 TaxID=3140744 RepID=UPI003EC116AA
MSLLSGGLSLNDSIEDISAQIKNKPQDADLRIHLFQYLSFLGLWDRAKSQLEVCAKLNKQSIPMVAMYQSMIQAEQKREQVVLGKNSPKIIGVDEASQLHAEQMFTALNAEIKGDFEQALSLRQSVLDQTAENPCQIKSVQPDGKLFNEIESNHGWLMDADTRFSNVCEFYRNGEYYWIPFAAIQTMTLLAPKSSTDLIWVNASIVLKNDDQEHIGVIPARYPLLQDKTSLSDMLLTCKTTGWQEKDGGFWGEGQKVFTTDQDDFGLLDIRHIDFGLS